MPEAAFYKPTSEEIGTELQDIIVVAVKKIYGNNGFVIFACSGNYTVKGNCTFDIIEGAKYIVSGKVGTYGKQIQISASSIEPVDEGVDDVSYIAAFLKDTFEGLGQKTADKLAAQYKEDVLRVLLEKPKEAAKEIAGLSAAKAMLYSGLIDEDRSYHELLMKIRMLGLSKAQSEEVFEEFGLSAFEEIDKNPYLLLRCKGIGFETCERIAGQKGCDPIDPMRFAGAIECVLIELHAMTGNTWFDPIEVQGRAMKLLFGNGQYDSRLTDPVYAEAEELAVKQKRIVIYRFVDGKCEGCASDATGSRIALRLYFVSEVSIKRELESFIAAKKKIPDRKKAEKKINEIAGGMGIVPDDKQMQALMLCMYQPVSVITGGPGTGKTTITGILAEHFRRENISCEFCAPTGRAAKRLSEASGMKANTIHRLLQMNADDTEKVRFGRNRDNPIEARVVVVDEASMMDTLVFGALLDAIGRNSSLILIGDPDQLPSVGAGNILEDILSCEAIPRVRLEYIFRQKDESSIASNSCRILKGEDPIGNETDFSVLRCANDDEALEEIKKLYVPMVKANEDVVILCPTKQNLIGTSSLNIELQELITGDHKEEVKISDGNVIHKGDKVMQVKNNYKIEYYDPSEGEVVKGIFNGETGTVGGKDLLTGKLDILFDDGRRVGYDKKMLSDIELAYAMTVHKSQGCEFDTVIIALGRMNIKLSNRKLLYTAVTRGKKRVIVVDSQDRLHKMITSRDETVRQTSLKDFLSIVGERHMS